jgi:hypothetical protein
VAGVPPYYVIQEALPPRHVFADDEEQRLYQTQQVGVEWRKDQKRVAKIILSYINRSHASMLVDNSTTKAGVSTILGFWVGVDC